MGTAEDTHLVEVFEHSEEADLIREGVEGTKEQMKESLRQSDLALMLFWKGMGKLMP